MQPPTRDDWITDIREAVDAASPGSDSDPDEDYTKSLRKSVDDKYLRLRRLTAELRGKDIELSKVLESKMKIMYEILDIVQGNNIYLLCFFYCFSFKLKKVYEDRLDSIPSPSTSVKIQIIVGKVYLRE